ncbi:hypothetical protein [Vibrio vulnificus]|uniref:hypothetical protein n=1 Tax=Vibrio vulnificus TaxID=672 RepID=UPI0011AFBA79|nr:hypothetical protein [Vibrio vulnificus]
MKKEKPLLILSSSRTMSIDSVERLRSHLDKKLSELGVDYVFVGDSQVQYHQPISDLVDAIKAQTEAINQLALSNIEILDQLIPEQVDEQDEESGKDIEPQSLD